MFHRFDHRAGHYLLLALLWAACCLPNLGGPSLWDIDEGLNAEAAREMLIGGNWVVPTFNYQLRTAKPVLLYWLQMASYAVFGISEMSARLPSALATLLSLLAVYELGRATFTAHTALLAGVILGTTIAVLGAAHFANPDALLLAFTTWTCTCYYRFWQTNRGLWLHAGAVACGFAVLAKGPVGLLLPAAIFFLFLLWQRDLRRLLDWRQVEAFGVFLLVAVPWYAWVSAETKGLFLKAFWHQQHVQRVSQAMEYHDGFVFYYVVVLIVGLTPWSIFLFPTLRAAWRSLGEESERPALRFLILWIAIWIVAFSVARTKLPNYVLPAYPAVALLIAHALEGWRRCERDWPAWFMPTALVCLALVGLGTASAMLLVGGRVGGPIPPSAIFPGLAAWAWLGCVPVVGAILAWRMLQLQRRSALLTVVAATAVVFLGGFLAGPMLAFNAAKPTPHLAAALPEDQHHHEVRLATFGYERPSLVFYSRREVRRVQTVTEAADFLREPLPAYLFVKESNWKRMRGHAPAGVRVLGGFPDLYARQERVLAVTNVAEVP